MNKKKAIEILNLPKKWTTQDVRRAYKRKALELHPDRNTGDANKFIEIKQAHDILINTESYDENEIHIDLEEFLKTIQQKYKEAIVPFILALPEQKQKWMIHFLEMYGSVLLGDDIEELLRELRELREPEIEIQQESMLIYIDEIIRDQVIIQNGEYIPSWCLEWNGFPVYRQPVDGIDIDISNELLFIVKKNLKDVFKSNHELITFNQSYFSGEHMIHLIVEVERKELEVRDTIQYIPFKTKHLCIYHKNGEIVWNNPDFQGCIHPDEKLDGNCDNRIPYKIGVCLI